MSENSLARAALRYCGSLLGDETRSPRYIETVATVGYRWVCKVEVAEETLAVEEVPAVPAVPLDDEMKAAGNRQTLGWVLTGGGVLVLCLAGAVWYLHRLLPPPRITKFNQITHDGRGKYLVGTDGSRVYFMQNSPRAIAQVGSNGGEIAPVPIASIHGPADLWDISPDGNSALIATGNEGDLNHTVWSVRILGAHCTAWGISMTRSLRPTAQFSLPTWRVTSTKCGAMERAKESWPRPDARPSNPTCLRMAKSSGFRRRTRFTKCRLMEPGSTVFSATRRWRVLSITADGPGMADFICSWLQIIWEARYGHSMRDEDCFGGPRSLFS